MISHWMRAQDRKRGLVAAASTLVLYAVAFLGAWLIGSLAPATLASVPSTVIVDLGGREGPPGATPLGLPNAPDRPLNPPLGAAPLPAADKSPAKNAIPAAAPAAQPKTAPAAAKAQPAKSGMTAVATAKAANAAKAKAAVAVAAAQAAVNAAAAKQVAAQKAVADAKQGEAEQAAAAQAAAVQAAAAAQVAAEAAARQQAAAQAAAEIAAKEAAIAAAQAAKEEADAEALAAERAAPAKSRTFGSSSSSSGAPVATEGGTGSSPGVEGGTGTVTFRGSEMGSALATTFGASAGLVGRNIYVPIYQYMPLPQKIDDAVYRGIAAKESFKKFYQQSGSEWRLKAQVPVAQRPDYWDMLERAGFDASTADYRTAQKLNPVTLEFAVGPLSKNRAELIDLRLVSSSGSSEVDEAVMYGFRQAAYFNKTGNAVAGKFVYSF